MGFRDREPEERVVYVERDSGGGSFRWFVIGAALGAGLGLLFAPRSGARTRRELGRRLGNLKEQAEGQLESLADGIEEGAERIRQQVDRWSGEEGDEAAGEDELLEAGAGEEEAGDEEPVLSAREELEHRLQLARARRRRRNQDDLEEEPVA